MLATAPKALTEKVILRVRAVRIGHGAVTNRIQNCLSHCDRTLHQLSSSSQMFRKRYTVSDTIDRRNDKLM